MQIKSNFSLKTYNTFGIDAAAKLFAEVKDLTGLRSVITSLEYQSIPKLILGGGSNILFTGDFEGIVIKIAIKGMELIKEDANHVWVKAGAGEVWHDLVTYCIENNFAGIENLSLIPGLVGAAPIQNIGAYGVELKEVFEELEALSIKDGSMRIFTNSECAFGYRDSIFKNELKNKYVVTSVTLKLNKKPKFNVSYGAIKEALKEMNEAHSPAGRDAQFGRLYRRGYAQELSIRAIGEAVCQIRRSKLPDPAEIGNAGSFFKNPEIDPDVSGSLFLEIKKRYPDIVSYPLRNGNVKIPAGWLVERSGWKGKRIGNTGTYKDHALVLVNYGKATGKEINEAAMKIKDSVKKKFGIVLKNEVNVI
ncbi:MAG: UDP-N-acetylmuramate dehydrogenase [Cytophagales bacterium]|nr:UDP-N-acetylmuramate dehydrogenase [Cytophagales bacterium]